MYIHGFVDGILSVIVLGIVVLIVIAVRMTKKK